MPKPLDQIPPFRAGTRTLSAADMNAIRIAAQSLASNFTVAAPLEKRQGADGVQLRVNTKRMLPMTLPAFDAVLAFDSATGTVYWLETTDACPTTTTTTAAPTTTTA